MMSKYEILFFYKDNEKYIDDTRIIEAKDKNEAVDTLRKQFDFKIGITTVNLISL